MATGIPKNGWNALKPLTNAPIGTKKGRTDVYLTYEGKKSEEEILELSPAQCRLLWTNSKRESQPSRLYYGDNLPVLAAMAADPAIRGQVRLIYIDPPYATKSVFQSRNQADAYTDLLEGAHYLEFLRERLILMRELLADDGSIYVHLDDKMAFLAKAVMDEVFGRSNFRNWITRKKCNPKNYTKKAYGNVSDFILFYSKTASFVWHRPVETWTTKRAHEEYSNVEAATGRRFKKVPIHAPGVRNGETGRPWRGKSPPPGKHWQYTPSTLDAMDARGEIYWSANQNPRRKIYLDSSVGIPVQDIWVDFRDAHNQNIRVSGYPTEKNPDLISRIVKASSNPGDLVLDCFAGSGTTLAVSAKLGRRWIGVDNSKEAIQTILRRFARGLEPMGDFVEPRAPSAPHLSEETTLPLFGLPTPTSNVDLKTEKHSPVADFQLLAQEPYQDEICDALAQWNDWIAPFIEVREKSRRYSVSGRPQRRHALHPNRLPRKAPHKQKSRSKAVNRRQFKK